MLEIKKIEPFNHWMLEEFLYWAIFFPPGTKPPDRSIIFNPDIFIYIKNYGQEHDWGIYAERNGKAVGAAWARIIPAYGHIDNNTPELAVSILPEYRNQGIGKRLIENLFSILSQQGYRQTSLSVQKENAAVHLYLRLGYKIVKEKSEDFLMLKKLSANK